MVAQDQDLSIPGHCIGAVDAKDLEDAPQQTVEEGQGHDGSLAHGVLAGQTGYWRGFWTLQVLGPPHFRPTPVEAHSLPLEGDAELILLNLRDNQPRWCLVG